MIVDDDLRLKPLPVGSVHHGWEVLEHHGVHNLIVKRTSNGVRRGAKYLDILAGKVVDQGDVGEANLQRIRDRVVYVPPEPIEPNKEEVV